MLIRTAEKKDTEAIWRILEPTIRAGETYTLKKDLSMDEAIAYWCSPSHKVFVAEIEGEVVGTYYIRPNQQGGGRHFANCGYMTAGSKSGKGIARAMCSHSLQYTKEHGYHAIQFNFVVSSNERAVRLWQQFGFQIVGTLPGAFEHPKLGYVDAFVMYKKL